MMIDIRDVDLIKMTHQWNLFRLVMIKKISYVRGTDSPDVSNFESFPQKFGKLFCLILYIIIKYV